MKNIPSRFFQKKILLPVCAVLLACGGWLVSTSGVQQGYGFEITKNIDVYGRILQEIELNYFKEVNPDDLTQVCVDAMLRSLDPYTSFITEDELEDFRYISTGQYGGIGATLTKYEDRVIISQVYKDRPAYKAGVRSGDEILKIDDVEINEDHSSLDVRNMLRGNPKTDVQVAVKRYGQDAPVKLTITRADVKIDNVPYGGIIKDGIGYVALRHFTQDAALDVRQAIEQMKKENGPLRGVILDLRGNPGGLLSEAVALSNLFVSKGEKIVETRGKLPGSYQVFNAKEKAYDLETPVAVLINGSSASASEIVSGVMQDLDRGVVIGEKSFGKGLVQTTRQLPYSNQLKVTSARYYTPSGRCIQAIDYSNKEENGKAERTPDSLKTEFQTRNGRKVVDADGVLPDIEVEAGDAHSLTVDLVRQRIIYDFVTKYVHEHPNPPGPRDIRIDDKIYKEFVAYVRSRDFKTESNFSKSLDKLDDILAKQAYQDEVEPELQKLKEEIRKQRENDIYAHRKEISRWLRLELATRYHYTAGRVQASFEDDDEILKAMEILNNPSEYRKILSGAM